MASRISLPNNLDIDIWAQTGEKIKPDDNPNDSTTYSKGYIAAPPVNTTDNYYKNIKDNAVANIVQNGVSEFNPTVTYSKGSIVSYYQNDVNHLYLSKVNNNFNVVPPLPNGENSNWIDLSNASIDQELQTFADSQMTKVAFNNNTLVADKRLDNVSSDLSLTEKQALSQKIAGEINQTNDSQILQTDSNGDIIINAFDARGRSVINGGSLEFIAGANSGGAINTNNGYGYINPDPTNGLKFIANGSVYDFLFSSVGEAYNISLALKGSVAYTNTPANTSNDDTIPTTRWVKNLLGIIFPVGSHIIQTANPNGDGVHLGVWEKITGDFSITSGDSSGYININGNSPVSGSVNGHALTIDEMPAHTHTYEMKTLTGGSNSGLDPLNIGIAQYETSATGGSQQHTHTLNIKSYAVVMWVRTS